MADTEEGQTFHQIPWTAALLKQPDLVIVNTMSRTRKKSNEDALFARTFNTEDTFSDSVSFYKTPSANAVQIEETSVLFSMGTGMDGWPKILHGGIVATIIDEAMGVLLMVNSAWHRRNPGRNEGPNKNMSFIGGGSLTAELKTTYKRPVRTPGVVLAVSRYVRREGRKDWIECEIRQFDEETQQQVVCAIGEALFIAKRAALVQS